MLCEAAEGHQVQHDEFPLSTFSLTGLVLWAVFCLEFGGGYGFFLFFSCCGKNRLQNCFGPCGHNLVDFLRKPVFRVAVESVGSILAGKYKYVQDSFRCFPLHQESAVRMNVNSVFHKHEVCDFRGDGQYGKGFVKDA